MTIFETFKQGDLAEFQRVLTADDLHRLDEDGWTLLNWAASKGDLETAKLLVQKGANVHLRGRDNRTPYMIALAAGHVETARYLKELEERTGGDEGNENPPELRPYCKAYTIGSLREFPGWKDRPNEGEAEKKAESPGADPVLEDDEIVFIHQDHSVTRSVIHGQNVIFTGSAPDWQLFCSEKLRFKVPTDMDLLTTQ